MCFFVMLMTSCATEKVVYKTEVQYVHPEIPESILEQCDAIPSGSIQTNGDLLMSYISLQSSYAICSSKVNSIRMSLESYEGIYNSDVVQP